MPVHSSWPPRTATPAVLHALIAERAVPLPGSGETAGRFAALADTAGADLSLGRLFEGHTDAVAILAEVHRAPVTGAAYGVWAAQGGGEPTVATVVPEGWLLRGTKMFCSGVGLIDRALVTATAADGYRLFDVDLADPAVRAVEGSWPSVGMSGSASLTVEFDAVLLEPQDAVGGPGFYLERPGFWFGGAGVAACWFGGARALVEDLVAGAEGGDDHALAETGRALTAVRTMGDVLASVAADIDADPTDRSGRAAYRTLSARAAVHDGCARVLDHVAAAGGARTLSLDGMQSRRAADLAVYLTQHHPGRDAAEIARLARRGPLWR